MKNKKIFTIMIIGMLLTTISCKKDTNSDTTNPTGNNTPTPTEHYFEATIDGATVKFVANTNGYSEGAKDAYAGSTLNGNGWEWVPCSFFCDFSLALQNLPSKNEAGIGIIRNTTTDITELNDYINLISVKSYGYGKMAKSTSENGIEGAYVYYVDNNGKLWTSDKGTANQTGSAFSLTEYTNSTSTMYKKECKATFSCKLYDGAGNVKTLTNGKLWGGIITW